MRIVIERMKNGQLKVMTDEPGLHEAIEVIYQQGKHVGSRLASFEDCWVFPDHEYVERLYVEQQLQKG